MYSVKRGNRYLLFTLLSYCIGSVFIGLFVFFTKIEMDITAQIIISQWGIVFIPIVLYFIITKSPIEETLLLKKINIINILLCFALAFAIIPLLSLINVISQFFVKNLISDVILDIAKKPLWLSLSLMALTPAILEEIAMRSIIINNYRSKPILTTCLISGFFFGMFHMNLNQFFYAFAMGIIMCFVVHITGSIISSMIIHFTINASSLILVKLLDFAQNFLSKINPEYAAQIKDAASATVTTSSLIMSAVFMMALCVFTIPIALLILYALMKYNNKTNIFKNKLTTGDVLNLDTSESLSNEKIITPSLIISITIFGTFVIFFEILSPLISKLLSLA